MKLDYKVILIAGSSHVGKTTLAARLADAVGCQAISTDRLARHPGRPWPSIPKPVVDFYEKLPAETIYWFLRVHHENMWAALKSMINDHVRTGGRVVLEGSALRPEYIASLVSEAIHGVCLYAPEAFLRQRMQDEARYPEVSAADRRVIDKFIERSLRDNSEMREAAKNHDLPVVDISRRESVERLFQSLVKQLAENSGRR